MRGNRTNHKPKSRPVLDCICGDHCFSVTTKGHITIVSPEDRHWLEDYAWNALTSSNKRVVYAKSDLAGGSLHRLILNPRWPLIVDHSNMNGSDNRRNNIRPCTEVQNAGNLRAKTGRKKGVFRYFRDPSRFKAVIGINRKPQHLGIFDTEDEAHEAYLKAAREYFGEFARAE